MWLIIVTNIICPDGWGENKILEWVRFVSVVSVWRFWLVKEVLRVEGFLSLELLATYWMVEGFLQFGAFS